MLASPRGMRRGARAASKGAFQEGRSPSPPASVSGARTALVARHMFLPRELEP